MLIRILKPFTEQYELMLESDMNAMGLIMRSKMKMRWDFNVINVNDHQIEARLILLNHELIDSNNPFVKEVAEVTQVFSKMYDEVHVILNHKGSVLSVVNLDFITSKWKAIKAEMEKQLAFAPDLQNVMTLNDNIFSSSKNVALAIESNEFFTTFFSKIYGRDIPYETEVATKNNFLNTLQIQWHYNALFSKDRPVGDILPIRLIARPAKRLGNDYCRKAYSQFADKVDVTTLNPVLEEIQEAETDKNDGRLIATKIHRNETASHDLFLRINYHLYGSRQSPFSSLKEPELQGFIN